MTFSEFGFLHWGFVFLFVIVAVVFYAYIDDDIGPISLIFVLAFSVFVSLSIANEFTPSEDERDRLQDIEDARLAQERATPKKVSEFEDGCVLYRFYDSSSRENFVTRCPDRTTTTSKHTRTQGKSTVTDTTTIETINQ